MVFFEFNIEDNCIEIVELQTLENKLIIKEAVQTYREFFIVIYNARENKVGFIRSI